MGPQLKYRYFFIFRFARFASLLTRGFVAFFPADDAPDPSPFLLTLALSFPFPSILNFDFSFVIAALTCFFASLLATLSAFAAFSCFLCSFDKCSSCLPRFGSPFGIDREAGTRTDAEPEERGFVIVPPVAVLPFRGEEEDAVVRF